MKRLANLPLIALSALLVAAGIFSLGWRFQHDSPIMFYVAFLIDRFGYVPYRDVFDMNMPGAHLAYLLIGRLFGYSDLGVRIADLCLLSAALWLNWQWMKKLGTRVAWCGTVLWGLMYLGQGPRASLQREFLILLPLIAGLLIFSSTARRYRTAGRLVVGFCFGLAATIKPHAVVGFPVLLLLDFPAEHPGAALPSRLRSWFKGVVLPAAAGFSVPLAAMLLFLWTTGALGPFLATAGNYWSLYAHLTGGHETIAGTSRLAYLFRNFRELGNVEIWLASGALGAYIALYESRLDETRRRQVLLLVALTLCYSSYAVFAGQFWPYHWLLFLFLLVQLSSLCLIARPDAAAPARRAFPAVVLTLVVLLTLPFGLVERGLASASPARGRVDEIATFLQRNLGPDDTVQALDWTAGVIHAMLIAEARLATRFIYDFHFYHHVSNPYIQGLRRTFIDEMKSSRPRYVIEIVGGGKPWVSGADTTRAFDELHELLDEDYAVVSTGSGYQIHELQPTNDARLRPVADR